MAVCLRFPRFSHFPQLPAYGYAPLPGYRPMPGYAPAPGFTPPTGYAGPHRSYQVPLPTPKMLPPGVLPYMTYGPALGPIPTIGTSQWAPCTIVGRSVFDEKAGRHFNLIQPPIVPVRYRRGNSHSVEWTAGQCQDGQTHQLFKTHLKTHLFRLAFLYYVPMCPCVVQFFNIISFITF